MLKNWAIKATISNETHIDCTLRTNTADKMQKKNSIITCLIVLVIMTRKDYRGLPSTSTNIRFNEGSRIFWS